MHRLNVPLLAAALAISATHAFAQTPEFEVASIRPADPSKGVINARTPSLNVDSGRNLTFVQTTLRDMIMLAYGVGAPQISGPDFLNADLETPADRFDVVARVPEGSTRDQVPMMLRKMLADRFHLAFHRENKQIQVYALELGKGPIKMNESPAGSTGEAACTRSFAERKGATLAAVCSKMTGANIAQQLQTLAPGYFREGPIVDLTGLKGIYDFKLEWITRQEDIGGSPGPNMFNAVQDQLGLKLTPRKQAVEVLVIDKLDRAPTEN